MSKTLSKTEKLKKLDKKYKCCKVLKWVLLILSLIVAVAPAVFVAFKVAPYVPTVSFRVGLSCVALFVLAIGLIFIIRGLNTRYGHKLPWATTPLVWCWILYLLLFSLEKVITQARQISLALAVGSSIAFVLVLASEIFRVTEGLTKEEYERLK